LEEDTMKLMRLDRLDAIVAAALYSGIITAAVSYFESDSFFQKYREEQAQVFTRMIMGYNRASNHWAICERQLAELKQK
jgi:hypothetical protein